MADLNYVVTGVNTTQLANEVRILQQNSSTFRDLEAAAVANGYTTIEIRMGERLVTSTIADSSKVDGTTWRIRIDSDATGSWGVGGRQATVAEVIAHELAHAVVPEQYRQPGVIDFTESGSEGMWVRRQAGLVATDLGIFGPNNADHLITVIQVNTIQGCTIERPQGDGPADGVLFLDGSRGYNGIGSTIPPGSGSRDSINSHRLANGETELDTNYNDGSKKVELYDTEDSESWLKQISTYDPDGNILTQKEIFDSLGEQLKEFDTGSTHGWQELDVTKDPTGKITNTQVTLDPTVAAVGSVAQVLGSAIGRALAPNNQLAQLAAGTLAGTVASAIGQKFGQVLSASLSDNAANISLDGVFNGFGLNLGSAGAGSVASLITAELGTALGLHGYGAQLFDAGVGGLASQVATQLVQKGGLSALNAINWTEALGGAAASLGGAVGSILGSQIVHAETQAGAIGGQLLGAIGSVIGAGIAIGQTLGLVLDFVIPGIGSLIGTILGTLLGDAFGASTPHPASTHIVDWTSDHYTDRFYAAVEGGQSDTSKAMADAAAGVVNSYLDAVHGAALDHGKQVMTGYQTVDPSHPYFSGWLPGVTHYATASEAVFATALDVCTTPT
jgi:hypothetical protein